MFFDDLTIKVSFKACINDAITRYKKVYQNDNFDLCQAKEFLEVVELIFINSRLVPRITFYPDGIMVVFTVNQQEVTVDYNFDELKSILVSKFAGNILYAKKSALDRMSQAVMGFLK